MHVWIDNADVNGLIKHLPCTDARTVRRFAVRALSRRNVQLKWAKEDCFGIELTKFWCVMNSETRVVRPALNLARIVPMHLYKGFPIGIELKEYTLLI